MSVTVSGIITVFIFLLFRNASLPMLTTLLPSIFSGTVTFSSEPLYFVIVISLPDNEYSKSPDTSSSASFTIFSSDISVIVSVCSDVSVSISVSV